MTKNIETEIRGKLDAINFQELSDLLVVNAKLKDHYKRLSVDLSPGFDPVNKTWESDDEIDLRVKKSGNAEKISLKIGKVNSKKRMEIDVKLEEGQFLNTILLLENLGFDKGMMYFWESWEYEYEGYEIKLSKYTDTYYTWEIESLRKNDPATLAKKLNLKPYTEKEYKDTIDWENQNIHRLFSYKEAREFLKKMEK